MSDNYGARCELCDINQPACCDMCTACIAQLRSENAKLKKSIGLNFDWVEIDGERVYTSYDQKLREENAKLLAVMAKLKKIQPTKPRRCAESYQEWFDDGWNTCVERIEAALREGKE